MAVIQWDEVGERFFETGVDRGVLYIGDLAVPWNGLVSISERSLREQSPVYYDGVKISNLLSSGDFEGVLTAYTYPEEFDLAEGTFEVGSGVSFTGQSPVPFDLCYRTTKGNDLLGVDYGYKIHVLYNVVAVPDDTTYSTLGDEIAPIEFSWNISAVPEDLIATVPTSHVIIDSKKINADKLRNFENYVYGTDTTTPKVPKLIEYIALLT